MYFIIFLGATSLQAVFIALINIAFGTVFSFVTLPVEYDASNRALQWLKSKNMLTQHEQAGAEDALKWAARTYVVAAIGSLVTLLYFAMRVFGGRREQLNFELIKKAHFFGGNELFLLTFSIYS